MFGAFLGVALVTVLANGLDLAEVSSDVQTMITGFLIMLAVGLEREAKAGPEVSNAVVGLRGVTKRFGPIVALDG